MDYMWIALLPMSIIPLLLCIWLAYVIKDVLKEIKEILRELGKKVSEK